jgi:hypothetical protein
LEDDEIAKAIDAPDLDSAEIHVEMLQHRQMIEWQRLRDADEPAWRQKQAERDRQWRLEDQTTAAAAFRRERYKGWAIAAWTLFAAAATWLIALATLSQGK